MPIYEYQAKDPEKSCEKCLHPFEELQKISDPTLTKCPACGNLVRKIISVPSVGGSVSGFDDRAKSAGFSKFQKLGKGEYERKY
ncbi:MAG: zinc ribbon domain-containing protein [Lentisphaerae bacterium]|jgi:putative FmdB family regulatory protein|nr:zinc ribbon domain-containing protein [Lentisphaerota bacterium]